VHLKIHNITDDKYWDGDSWEDAATELNGTHLSNGNWYYDFAPPDGDAGDRIEWFWYNETDETVVLYEQAEIFEANAILIQALTAILSDSTSFAGANVDGAISDIPANVDTELTSEHGSGLWNRGGAITLSAESTDITVTAGEAVDDNGNISVTRDDDTDIQFTWTDQDVTGYTIYLTVRESLLEAADPDDSEAIFQVEAALTTPASGIFTFTISQTQTDECTPYETYWYDVCAIAGDGDITTVIKGRFEVTGDATRRTAI